MYLAFLKKNGWKEVFKKEMAARIVLMYTECRRKTTEPYDGADTIKNTEEA